MKWIALFLLFAAISGCLGADDPSDDEMPGATDDPPPNPGQQPSANAGPGTNETPPTPSHANVLWDGQPLEGVDCKITIHLAAADRDAVEARVPDRLVVPGDGPVLVSSLLFECDALTVGNVSFQKDASVYMTYVAVDDPDFATEDTSTYLLEFGSDLEAAWAPLQQRGAYAVGGTFQHDVTADTNVVTFRNDDLSYTFSDAGDNPYQVERGPERSTLLAGPDAEVALRFVVPITAMANLPLAGTMQLEGGALAGFFGPAAPSLVTDGSGGVLFQEIPAAG